MIKFAATLCISDDEYTCKYYYLQKPNAAPEFDIGNKFYIFLRDALSIFLYHIAGVKLFHYLLMHGLVNA